MVTVLFIVYQFTFVAELGESSGKAQEARGRRLEAGNRKHPRDVNFRDAGRMMARNTGDGGGKDEKHGGGGEEGAISKVDNARQAVNDENMDQGSRHAKPQQSMTLTFKCETSGRQISVDKLNDNYCDCPEDGSDEPRTNACASGRFMCLKHKKPFPQSIPSGWVNDGVCDCCDGSDEWKMRKGIADLAVSLQKKIGRYLSPCPNQCPDAL